MLGGISFQLGMCIISHLQPLTEDPMIAVIVVYAFLIAEFFVRYSGNNPFRRSNSSSESLPYPKPMTTKIMIMSFGIILCTLCLFIRSVILRKLYCA